MLEIDGPAVSYFVDEYGDTYYYTTYAISSDTPGPLVNMLAKHMKELHTQYPDGVLVWRRRPVIEFQKATPELQEFNIPATQDRWVLNYRMVVVPHCNSKHTILVKPEGKEIAPL